MTWAKTTGRFRLSLVFALRIERLLLACLPRDSEARSISVSKGDAVLSSYGFGNHPPLLPEGVGIDPIADLCQEGGWRELLVHVSLAQDFIDHSDHHARTAGVHRSNVTLFLPNGGQLPRGHYRYFDDVLLEQDDEPINTILRCSEQREILRRAEGLPVSVIRRLDDEGVYALAKKWTHVTTNNQPCRACENACTGQLYGRMRLQRHRLCPSTSALTLYMRYGLNDYVRKHVHGRDACVICAEQVQNQLPRFHVPSSH